MGNYAAYPAYKKSGVEWLGEIPAHWPVKKIGYVTVQNSGGAWGTEDDEEHGTIVLRSTEQTVDGKWQIGEPARRLLSPTEKRQTLLISGDLLITKSSGSRLHIGKTTIVDQEVETLQCGFSNFMQRLRMKVDQCPKFYYYLFNSTVGREQFDFNSNTTTGLANLTSTVISATLYGEPPLPEQEAIARFLDHKTAQIDALIARKEALLARLADKRTALISQAVTKGLDPTVPLRDSGIEWLGEIPAHWVPSRIKYFSRRFNGATPNTNNNDYWEDGTIPWLASGKVNEDIVTEPSKWITEQALKECPLQIAPKGSVIIGMVGQGRTRGMAAYLGIDTTINQNMAAIVPGEKLNGRFLHLFLQQAYQQIRDHGRGANQPALNVELVSDIPIVLPPIQEQQEIVLKLEDELQKLLEINDVIYKAIDKLKQYRTALITNAVTGKIDVRNGSLPPASAVERTHA